jgi:hypothetical protein
MLKKRIDIRSNLNTTALMHRRMATMLMLCICFGIVLTFLGDRSDGQRVVHKKLTTKTASMRREEESARVVDVHDLGAVERWARNMCRGFNIKDAAHLLETEATVSAVARSLARNLPEPAEATARLICEEELRKANPGTQ